MRRELDSNILCPPGNFSENTKTTPGLPNNSSNYNLTTTLVIRAQTYACKNPRTTTSILSFHQPICESTSSAADGSDSDFLSLFFFFFFFFLAEASPTSGSATLSSAPSCDAGSSTGASSTIFSFFTASNCTSSSSNLRFFGVDSTGMLKSDFGSYFLSKSDLAPGFLLYESHFLADLLLPLICGKKR